MFICVYKSTVGTMVSFWTPPNNISWAIFYCFALIESGYNPYMYFLTNRTVKRQILQMLSLTPKKPNQINVKTGRLHYPQARSTITSLRSTFTPHRVEFRSQSRAQWPILEHPPRPIHLSPGPSPEADTEPQSQSLNTLSPRLVSPSKGRAPGSIPSPPDPIFPRASSPKTDLPLPRVAPKPAPNNSKADLLLLRVDPEPTKAESSTKQSIKIFLFIFRS
uniref:Uncharacterized protein n=1 Tax=Acrobeloides nanus TaxID=290746 RepID=A0A914CMR9_9BILA